MKRSEKNIAHTTKSDEKIKYHSQTNDKKVTENYLIRGGDLSNKLYAQKFSLTKKSHDFIMHYWQSYKSEDYEFK